MESNDQFTDQRKCFVMIGQKTTVFFLVTTIFDIKQHRNAAESQIFRNSFATLFASQWGLVERDTYLMCFTTFIAANSTWSIFKKNIAFILLKTLMETQLAACHLLLSSVGKWMGKCLVGKCQPSLRQHQVKMLGFFGEPSLLLVAAA